MYQLAANDTLAELGVKYQFRLLYYTCALSDFGREILPHLSAEMFDQPQYKQLVTLIRSYWDKYGQLPNVDNLRLMLLEERYLSPVDKEILGEELNKFHQLRVWLHEGRAHNDSQQVMELAWRFIQDRAMRSIKQELDSMVMTRSYDQARPLAQRFHNALQLGSKDTLPVSPLRVTRDVWRERYPNAIPTGIPELDKILPGGLPPGHLGLILGGTGIGKSSLLTLLADNAWELGHDVLHIVFAENSVDLNVTPKYHAKWSGIPVDDMRFRIDEMENTIERVTRERAGRGSVAIKSFVSKDTTVRVLETWIQRYEEQNGIRFALIVLDYLDEIRPERTRGGVKHEGQVEVAEDLHQLCVTLNRPIWTGTQGNGASQNTRLLYHEHCGGSQEKLKKAQVVLTIGADNEQKNQNKVNVILLKSNISKCGHIWEDSDFDRDRLRLKFSNLISYAPAEEIEKTYEAGQYRSTVSAGPPPVPEVAEASTAAPWRTTALPPSGFEDEQAPSPSLTLAPVRLDPILNPGANTETSQLLAEVGAELDNV